MLIKWSSVDWLVGCFTYVITFNLISLNSLAKTRESVWQSWSVSFHNLCSPH